MSCRHAGLLFALAMCQVAVIVSGQACTAADLKSLFTPCNTATGEMQSIQYFDKNCDNSGNHSVPLHSPRPTPCIKSCPSGTYYSPVTLGCEQCSPGEFSNSGGEIINTFGATLPGRFSSYCSPQPCEPWRVAPGRVYLDSGNQSVGVRHGSWFSAVDESVAVTLATVVNVINPRGGKVLFQYRVESEKSFDGLQLYFNGTLVKNADYPNVGTERFFATGIHHQFRQAAVPLPVGRTDVRFVYSKDANQLSEAGGVVDLDRAFLKDFTFEGVQMFAPYCTPCGPGEYADAKGAMDCKICAKDTFSTGGAQGCQRCGSTQWAPVGSAKCFDKLQCTAEDYVAVYGDCTVSPSDSSKYTRSRDWKLINSRCIETSSTIPASSDVACEICSPGFYVNDKLVCVPCESGSMYDSTTKQCTPCGKGSAALPIVDYSSGFDSLKGTIPQDIFSMSCSGLCSTCPEGQEWCQSAGQGFALAPFVNHDADNTIVGIRQDLANGNSYTSVLTYKFHMVSDGGISLSYGFFKQGLGNTAVPDELTATITIAGKEHLLDKYYVGPPTKPQIIQSLDGPADYELTFMVTQSGFVAPEDMYAATLLSMKITGDGRGAAGECTSCRRGHYCPGATPNFVPCPLGKSQASEGKSTCDACTGNSISKELGSIWCQSCDVGTVVSANHQLCENQCNFSFAGNRFDFTDLKGVIFGPLLPTGSRTDLTTDEMDSMNMYRFFISPCSLVNTDKENALKCSTLFGSDLEDAYSCQRLNGNQSYSAGDDLHYFVHPVTQQLTMRITGGTMCHRAGVARSTNVTFVCDPTQNGYGSMQYISEEPQCQYNFQYTSKYGCPVCTEDSFSRVETECSDEGVRSVSYFKKSFASQCHGGFAPPDQVNTTCEKCKADFYNLVWSDCENGIQTQSYVLQESHRGCVDDGTLSFPAVTSQQTCKKINAKIGANGFTFAILFVLGSVSLLFYSLYSLYYRHNRLQVEYQRLSNNAGEMAEMDDDDDDLDRHNTSSVQGSASKATSSAAVIEDE
ncbi:membrane-associated protein, putative [Bodo saltans]|uniref:Membrane-associated protein, putative n=2 Tax=Bodo saltans TaxID=75058 RepID=A0A0S4IMV7_BODSA|nr:membrane-associated protein, putative [Bodo saltans]|eukprot:CUE74841.1 membrane-associated protein, putative [Bodo saltans]